MDGKQVTFDEILLARELKRYNIKTLLVMAKQLDIKGRWGMNKDELIESIVIKKMEKGAEKKMAEIRTKEDYGKNVGVGVIIAFKYKDRLISGKIKAKSENGFRVQTIRGTEIDILRKDVEWYKTGRRWPKYIFNQLRGVTNEQKEQKEN